MTAHTAREALQEFSIWLETEHARALLFHASHQWAISLPRD